MRHLMQLPGETKDIAFDFSLSIQLKVFKVKISWMHLGWSSCPINEVVPSFSSVP